jgi:hypothetical protein
VGLLPDVTFTHHRASGSLGVGAALIGLTSCVVPDLPECFGRSSAARRRSLRFRCTNFIDGPSRPAVRQAVPAGIGFRTTRADRHGRGCHVRLCSPSPASQPELSVSSQVRVAFVVGLGMDLAATLSLYHRRAGVRKSSAEWSPVHQPLPGPSAAPLGVATPGRSPTASRLDRRRSAGRYRLWWNKGGIRCRVHRR